MFSFIRLDPAEAGKAAGWFKPEIRQGELWAADIKWTPKAKQMLKDREYRYCSPTFRHSEAGEVLELINVAITNLPATYGMDPLMASRAARLAAGLPEEETTPMEWKQLLAMLGLTEDATEAEAMAKLKVLQDVAGQVSALSMLTGKASMPESLGIIQAWKAAADQVPALTTKLAQMEQAQQKAEVDGLLTEGKRAGKVPPALEPVLRAMPLESLKAYLSAAPKLMADQSQEPAAGSSGNPDLSPAELQVAALTGIDPKEIAKRRALRAGRVPTSEPKDTAAAK
jgi:phage I-like protein